MVGAGGPGVASGAPPRPSGRAPERSDEARHFWPCFAEAEGASPAPAGSGCRGAAAGDAAGPPPPQGAGGSRQAQRYLLRMFPSLMDIHLFSWTSLHLFIRPSKDG